MNATDTTATLITDPQPPRPAASLVLVRDGAQGLEVLMMQRPAEDRVLAGAHVFPGGKVDAEDAHDAAVARIDAGEDLLHARMGEPELTPREAAALHVAAIREAFEEAGVLLADQVSAAQALEARAMRRDGKGFSEVMQTLGLRLDTDLMRPWSRWITPRMSSNMKKRFDTRFFLACLPPDQEVEHDTRETVGALWILPRAALVRYWEGGIDMAAPQVMTLAHLSRFASSAQALASMEGRTPPTIRPEPIEIPGVGRAVCYPGDPGHPEPGPVMPGPTRMHIVAGRFKPPGGFEDWFA
ncbi:MAG: NUDIX hydrolase [Burkholderiaceae bacterium]